MSLIEENRRKAVEHLRTTELPQGYGSLYSHGTKCYCAFGHCGLAVGIDARVVGDNYDEIEEALGLNFSGAREIWRMNDNQGRSLREIGDFLATKWGIA